ncbi:sulfite exporter TauE/SafE family protein [Paradesulfitobacterium ferrireducens]|uniref:sulfite exporter TauE/SafE family protein n=1 Tax=Paradesulfitobacterium ferrireducens TaxID=2816476 RepID=UPI001A8C56D1|nr:sulfite exporter TauE/SafE family protein [Paradesulfitobacterium ferrireducens]
MDYFRLAVIVLVATTLQVGTGFGFSIMATPFLLLLYDGHDAIQINIILSVVISLVMVFKIRHDADKAMLPQLIKGSIAGIPIGMAFFLILDVRFLKILVSVLILMLTFLLMLKLKIRQSKWKDLLSGGISGFLSTSLGMPGPPLLIYFSGIGMPKERMRSTILSFALVVYFVSFVLQLVLYGTNKTVWLASLSSLPVLAGGTFLGQILFRKLSQRLFTTLTYLILVFTGAYLLITSI